MRDYEFSKISVTDVAEKAGVGRATFYRHFKSKEDVIVYYFEHYTKNFKFSQRFYPRCKADHVQIAESAFNMFKEHIGQFKLIRKARLEYIYLDYLNKSFAKMFEADHPEKSRYTTYIYAGLLFNVSMAWLDNDCAEPAEELAKSVVEAIYFE